MTIRVTPIYASIPNPAPLYAEITAELREEGQDTIRMFERFFAEWQEKPTNEFRIDENRSAGIYSVWNYPVADEGLMWIIYWTIFGSEGHTISPREKPYLRYQVIFNPKTSDMRIDSQPGGKSGNWTTRGTVWHPGTHPRNTLELIDRERYNRVVLRLNMATRRGIEKARAAGRVRTL